MRDVAALIVGGGPAGATAAIGLARAGLPHLLVERSASPGDPLCGGFLSWQTLATLARLGVDAAELNPRPIRRVRLFVGDRVASADLPAAGVGVSRRRLDALLLERAAGFGARIERGVAVRAIDGLTAAIDGDTIRGGALFLASGKHEVRGAARPATRDADPAIGLRVRLSGTATLHALVGDAVELHLFDRGYAGVALHEDGSANVCLAVARSRLAQAGSPERLLAQLAAEAPALGERLACAEAGPSDAVANVPYGWRAADTADGVFRLGDQAAVIPSLAGEGMGIAIASGIRAASAYARGGAAAARQYQRALHRATARPVTLARIVRRLAEQPTTARALAAFAAPSLIHAVARLTRIGDSHG